MPADDLHAVLRLREERVERADGERADDRAPQARRAADDEHRERHERQVEIERARVQRQQMDVEPAREARERAREHERAEPLPYMEIPAADAAAGSSRVARSIRPKRLRW